MVPLTRIIRLAENRLELAFDPSLRLELRELGLIPDGEPRLLGTGARGATFVGRQPDTAVKVTTDPQEERVLTRLRGKDMPGIVRVHSVKRVVLGSGEFATAAVVDLLRPIPESDQEAAARAFDAAGYHQGLRMSDEIAERVARIEPRLTNLVRSCARLGMHVDLYGANNLMADSHGDWVLADLGPPPGA